MILVIRRFASNRARCFKKIMYLIRYRCSITSTSKVGYSDHIPSKLSKSQQNEIKHWCLSWCIGYLPRLTENVTKFSLALGGLIGGNWRVGVVYHCRLNLLIRWQSSSLSSSSGSLGQVLCYSWINLEDNRLLIDKNRSATKYMLLWALGSTPAKQLVLTGNSKHRTFRVSVSQPGPQPARSTQPVQLSAADLA